MTVRLHLGVTDVAYATAYSSARSQATRPASAPRHITTGDVAQFLEARYGVLEKFAEIHGQEIADAVAEAMEDKLEALLMGGPGSTGPILPEGTLGAIEQRFRKMLDNRELDGKIPGVPTQAALAGVSHRMARPYAGRGARPSFIDTGLYQSSFRAWVDET